jgi:hypothetical protein
VVYIFAFNNSVDESNLHQVSYTPLWTGTCIIDVRYGGHLVPLAPVHISVSSVGEADRVKIIGEFQCLMSALK